MYSYLLAHARLLLLGLELEVCPLNRNVLDIPARGHKRGLVVVRKRQTAIYFVIVEEIIENGEHMRLMGANGTGIAAAVTAIKTQGHALLKPFGQVLDGVKGVFADHRSAATRERGANGALQVVDAIRHGVRSHSEP